MFSFYSFRVRGRDVYIPWFRLNFYFHAAKIRINSEPCKKNSKKKGSYMIAAFALQCLRSDLLLFVREFAVKDVVFCRVLFCRHAGNAFKIPVE